MNTHRLLGLCSLLLVMGCLTVASYAGFGTGQVRAAPARNAATSTASSVSVVAVATSTPASSVSVVPVATSTPAPGSASVVPATVTASTPVTVATNTTLAAQPVLAMHVVAFRHGGILTFQWQMMMQSGIKGYRLFARSHALTHVIQPHHNATYRESLHWKGNGPFYLKILTHFGKPMRIRAGR